MSLVAATAIMSLILLTGCGSAETADKEASDKVTSFKGIPFAKPPVDNLRWKAPVAPDPSDREIECYAKTGDPSIESAEWTKYDISARDTMTINSDGWKMESDPSQKARELMTVIYPERPVSYDGLYEYNIWE